MPFLHLYAFLFLISIIPTQAQTWAWARQATSTTFSQTADKVRADHEGNVYLLAHSSGTAAFGQWHVNAGNYIARYKADGQIDWVMQVPLLSDIYPGNNGNLHIAGTFTGQLTIGSFSFTSHGAQDFFHAVVGNSGNVETAQAFGDSLSESVYALIVNSKNEAFLTGGFKNRTNLAGNILSDTNSSNLFVLKIDSQGNTAWSNKGDYSFLAGKFIGVDENDNIYVAGPSGQPCYLCSGSFLCKFDRDGLIQEQYEGWGPEDPIDHMIVRSGFIYLLHNTMSHYGFNAGISKFDAKLKPRISYYNFYDPYHGQSFDQSLAVDSKGNIYVAGEVGFKEWDPTLPFAGQTFSPRGDYDMAIVRLDSNCLPENCMWNGSYGTEGYSGIFIDQNDILYASGGFTDTLKLGLDTLINSGTLAQAFVAKSSKEAYLLSVPGKHTVTKISVFPNPCTDYLKIELPDNEIFSAKLHNLQGACILDEEIRKSAKIDSRNFTPGIYVLSVTGKSSTQKFKIVVQ